MAQQTITATANQTMIDLCLQVYGTSDLLVKFCTDNDISSVNYVPLVPEQFVYDDSLITAQKVNNYIFATAPPPGPPAPVIQSWQISVDHTRCGTADSANFAVEVQITSHYLKDIAHGGFVANSAGYDIQFYSDSGFTSLLNWEIEVNGYDPVTGTLHVWVLLPVISATANTVFYMRYGDSSITTFTGGATGSVWNSSYKMVHHFADGTTLSLLDSTANAHNMAIAGTGIGAGSGVIDGAVTFSNNGYLSVPSTTDFDSTTGTWSFWLSTTQNDASFYIIAGRSNLTSSFGLQVYLHNGKLQIELCDASAFTRFDSIVTVADGNQHYVSFQFKSATVSKLYIDGILDTSISTVAWTFNNQPLYIGAGYPGVLLPYHGMIDEFRISNVNVGFSTQLAEYNNQKDPGNIGTPGFLSYALIL